MEQGSDAALLACLQQHAQVHRKTLGLDPVQKHDSASSSQHRNYNSKSDIKHGKEEKKHDVWGKVNQKTYLPAALEHHYGNKARDVVVDNYDTRTKDSDAPRLIDNLLSTRNKEYLKQKDDYQKNLRNLNLERQQLLSERERLREKRTINKPPPAISRSGHSRVSWDDKEEKDTHHEDDDVCEVDSFIAQTSQDIPAQIARCNILRTEFNRMAMPTRDMARVREHHCSYQPLHALFLRMTCHAMQSHKRVCDNLPKDHPVATLHPHMSQFGTEREKVRSDYNRLNKPYLGELGPQSYEPWQMQDYYMARSIVEEIVEKFLNDYFSYLPQWSNRHAAHAVLEEETSDWEKQRRCLLQDRAIQLIMEGIVLEVTNEISADTADEFVFLSSYARNKTNKHFMSSVEAVARDAETERPVEDPAYNLVTKAFFSLQNDRDEYRSDVWTHTQHLHIKGLQQEVELIEADDVKVIDFHHISPMDLRQREVKKTDDVTVRQHKEHYLTYQEKELLYWQNLKAEVTVIAVSSKCQGVAIAKMSFDHKFLAIGTVHGDLTVYDMHSVPLRPLRARYNQTEKDDPIVNISWSLDARQLTTVTKKGLVIMWSMKTDMTVTTHKSDLKALQLKSDTTGISPESLNTQLIMDVKALDFRFQAGPLADIEVQDVNYCPTCAAFHSNMTLSGTQNTVGVAFENGDILLCDLTGNRLMEASPLIVHAPPLDTETTRSIIGQNIPTGLLRQHKDPIILIGYIDNMRDMVTVDKQGYIFLWRLSTDSLTSYEWHQPYAKYKLDLRKMMYSSANNTKSNIIYTDKGTVQGKQKKTRQDLAKERHNAEKLIDKLNLQHPWHRDILDDQGVQVEIYLPKQEVSRTGDEFHIITRSLDTKQLSTYLTRVYKPLMVSATKLLCCRQNPNGTDIVFVLLFPEYPPKDAHITIVVLDLHTVALKDFREDLRLTPTQYKQCMENDAVCCDITYPLGSTGSGYVFLTVADQLFAVSLTTGSQMLQLENPKKPPPNASSFMGCRVFARNFSVPAMSRVTVAGTLGRYQVIIYGTDKKQKKLQNQLIVLDLVDGNTDEDRLLMSNIFQTWEAHPALVSSSQRVNPLEFTIDSTTHPKAYAREIIMECVDQAIQAKENYTDEQIKAFRQLDRIRNYTDILPPQEQLNAVAEPGDTISVISGRTFS